MWNEQETLSTLRFGTRAKAIKNIPKINREYTVAELLKKLEGYQEKIKRKDKKIRKLEDYIRNAGLEVPKIDDCDNYDDGIQLDGG